MLILLLYFNLLFYLIVECTFSSKRSHGIFCLLHTKMPFLVILKLIFLQIKFIFSPNEFVLTGIHYFLELVNSSCYYAALVILVRAVATFSSRIHLLTGNLMFVYILK